MRLSSRKGVKVSYQKIIKFEIYQNLMSNDPQHSANIEPENHHFIK